MAFMMTSGIRQLPLSTQSKLRSTQILTSLPQVVAELVQNSLDASAGHVEVGVDCEEWSCWVRDDGRGMSKNDLITLATTGRYGTSKAYTPASLDEVATFGFRGEALASVADLCCLEISSRTQRSRECWSIISKGDEILYNGPAIRWKRESPGTTVYVRDAFYNLPVRRRSHPSTQRTLELIRKELEALALVFPQVSFSLENANRTCQERPERARIMAVPKTTSTLQTFRHLFGRALVEHVEEIHETSGSVNIDGFVSLEGAASKAYQYLYVNRHLLAPCELHRIIDASFSSSSFARHALDEYMEMTQPFSAIRRSPKKPDKKPVYVLNISIPPQQVDNCLEPAKSVVQLQNSDAVSTLLSSVVHSFLVKHGFEYDKTQQRRQDDAPPRKKRKLELTRSERSIIPSAKESRRPSSRAQTVLLSRSHTPIIVPEDLSLEASEDPAGQLLWTDPRTGETFVVDRRTGNSYPVGERRDDVVGVGGARRTLASLPSFVSDSFNRRQKTKSGTTETEMPQWIQEALDANDTYILSSQRAIPALSLSSSFAKGVDEWHRQHAGPSAKRGPRRCQDELGRGPLEARTHTARFSKESLRGARVLGQVDSKFVACVLQASAVVEDGGEGGDESEESKPTLVLIDQHAADERVRVERILKELCSIFTAGDGHGNVTPRVRHLNPPLPVLLTRHEAEQLAMSPDIRAAFELWGVRFAEESLADTRRADGIGQQAREGKEREDSGYAQARIESVPEILATKLLEEDTLRDLVKSYIAELVSTGNPEAVSLAAARSDGSSTATWQRAMRWCPRDLLELSNSKACRGAIMFNDVLKLERCERLVRELAETALPFQCAHGRPSLVPLASLGADVGTGHRGVEYSRHLQPIDWTRFGKEEVEEG